ncbi:MAG: hypothetical protein U0Q16_18500 [Bryobacteraceae bacterium]
MPVTDNYVVEFLLDATRHSTNPLRWREANSGGYWARMHGIRVRLLSYSTTAGAFFALTLSHAGRRSRIEEPRSTGFFGRKYATGEAKQLADLMRALAVEVRRQCTSRRILAEQDRAVTHEALVKRLLFGVPAKAPA